MHTLETVEQHKATHSWTHNELDGSPEKDAEGKVKPSMQGYIPNVSSTRHSLNDKTIETEDRFGVASAGRRWRREVGSRFGDERGM